MIKNAFYFITKVLFVLKIFNPKKAGGQFAPHPPPSLSGFSEIVLSTG